MWLRAALEGGVRPRKLIGAKLRLSARGNRSTLVQITQYEG